MIPFEQLHEQNHKISELSQVTMLLVRNRAMCDMDTTCYIFMMFVDEVNDHMKLEEAGLYSTLLSHSNDSVVNTGKKFLNGSMEIKKIFRVYTQKWCSNNKLRIKNHSNFIEDTESMMALIEKRILDESENLYPLVRSILKEVA